MKGSGKSKAKEGGKGKGKGKGNRKNMMLSATNASNLTPRAMMM